MNIYFFFLFLSSPLLSCTYQHATVGKRSVIIDKLELISAINNSNIQYTLPPIKINCISLIGFTKQTKDKYSIDRYDIKTNSTDQLKQILFLRLPITSTIKEYVEFLINKKKKLGESIKMMGLDFGIFSHFKSTLQFCEEILCANQAREHLIVNVYELFQSFLERFSIDKNNYSFMERIRHSYNNVELLKSIVLNESQFSDIGLNFVVFIPKKTSISQWIADCASRVEYGNENGFMKEILKECQLYETQQSQRAKWSKIIEEMKLFYYHPVDFGKLQKKPAFGFNKINLSKLNGALCLDAIQKINLQFTKIVPRFKSTNPIEIILDCIGEFINYHNIKIDIQSDNLLFLFIGFIRKIYNSKYFQHYFNLLTIGEDKFQEVCIERQYFNELIKYSLRNNTIRIHISPYDLDRGLPIVELTFPLTFPQFPFLHVEQLKNKEVLTSYANYIATLIDYTCDYDNVLKIFWNKFWCKQTLSDYQIYLVEKKFRIALGIGN